MEYLQDTILPLLRDHYSLSSLQNLAASATATMPSSLLSAHLSHLRHEYLDPYIVEPLSALLASSTPDLVSVLLLLAILYISLRILDYARRVVMFWVMLVFRLVFWTCVIGAGLYVYNVGLERASREVSWLWGVAQGFVEDVASSSSSSSKGWSANRSGGGSGSNSGYGRYYSGYQRGGRTW
ncbi:hypothetical protein VTN77DRAFT_4397 [Rasamsonia byssochlamydoides]|uniref:uncharacterized protein n=1 Tax=Rasamsonia byssochlamydoides TaxID=89139 RepID=UPI0037438396